MPVLHLHRAERADGLVEALRDLLRDPLPDPFAAEVVAVPTRGMERWLTQQLAGGLGAAPGRADGICANVAFPSPRRLVGEAVAVAAGVDPDADPWAPERAVWPLLDVVGGCLGESWCAPLARHLDSGDGGRRFAAVRHLAGLYDRYALHRPELVRRWAAGEDGRWQAELWRRLRERIGAPDPAERLGDACARLREAPALVALPARVALFGITRLPDAHLRVLRALAAGRDVHLFLLHPSPALWDAVAAAQQGRPAVSRRRDDPTARLARNRLLASWGQDVRELQLVLEAGGGHAAHHHHVPPVGDTLLGRLQAAVRADERPPGTPLPGRPDARPLLGAGDRSVEVHACHGRARQVEVVRDAVLHLLAEDATLEPRDVIVMCPDIETFAPLVQATFGGAEPAAGADDDGDGTPAPAVPHGPDLRVRLADRSLRQTNPLLGVVARLLELADQRLTASQVLDLADREPVRRRFGLDDDAVARLEDWVAAGGVRWGLDAAHRAPFRLDRVTAGTWSAGLDRLLLGAAMPEEGAALFGGVLPLDDVESGAIDLAGRMAELLDRLGAAVAALQGPQPAEAWCAALGEAASALTATAPREAWQRAELQRVLDDVAGEARDAGGGPALELAEARALLGERLQGRPTRANFRTGHLTVCTLMPMRSVPHRVVCLLGLDDGAFPRKAPRDGDDLMLADAHVGDRDARLEDRQLLLDALMAATDRLVVTYTGRDERTNVARPPAVPLGELLDEVDRTVRLPDERPARTRVVVEHPLQPFDPRNFRPGALAGDGPWGFDAVTLAGARAMGGERAGPGPFLAEPLPAPPPGLLALDDLVRFVQHPVRAFLRQRLGVSAGERDDEVEDALPIELDPLDEWAVGERLLGALRSGAGVEAAVAAEVARGTLPPGGLAGPALARVRPVAEAVAEEAAAAAGGRQAPRSVDVRVDLGGGRRIGGTVTGLEGDVLVTATYSRVAPKHRLAAYVRWLALAAARPDRPVEAVVAGRARRGAEDGARVTVARFAPLPGPPQERRGTAVRRLAELADLHERGLREPLPLPCQAAAAFAAAVPGPQAATAAKRAWESSWKIDGEERDLEHQLAFGGVLAFEHLLGFEPRAGESGPGWDDAEATRFGRLARRLWAGPLEHEELRDR